MMRKRYLAAAAAAFILLLSSCAARDNYQQKYEDLYEKYVLLENSPVSSDRPDPYDFRFKQYGFRDYEEAHEYIASFIDKEKGYTDPDKALDAAKYLVHYIEELMKYCAD